MSVCRRREVVMNWTGWRRHSTICFVGWMMPYAMFGMTKVPEEQGEWAGKVAIETLKGTKPSDIPIIPNRNFNIIVNNTLLDYAQIKLPEFIKLKAQPFY